MIFVVAVVVFVIWGKRFLQSSENLGKFSSGFGLPSAPLRYVVKAAGFALTSSIARTNRSQRSRELSGRMTGGGLISEQDSLVTSSNLGRYSSSLTRWRSKRNENDNFIFIGTALTNTVLKMSGTGKFSCSLNERRHPPSPPKKEKKQKKRVGKKKPTRLIKRYGNYIINSSISKRHSRWFIIIYS